MGLLSIIRKIKRKEKEMRILMVYVSRAQLPLSFVLSFSSSVFRSNLQLWFYSWDRGLDNSGKTTIVMKINGEDTSVISPTLGFNIKTIIYEKYSSRFSKFLLLFWSFGLFISIFNISGEKEKKKERIFETSLRRGFFF